MTEHDALTQSIWARLHADIDACAATGVVSPALATEARLIRLTPLDESAGEGYHRSTHHELTRACSSSTAHLKRTVRKKEILKKATHLLKKYGARAKRVVRHDWRAWSRILQTRAAHRWSPKRMKPQAVYRRLYREDEMAREDWGAIVKRVQTHNTVATDKFDEKGSVQREYLLAVLKPEGVYSVQHQAQEAQPDGGVADVERTTHFKVLDVVHSRSRPKLMPTVFSADEVVETSALVYYMQMFEIWSPTDEALSPDWRLVFNAEDPQWLDLNRVADFESFAHRLTVWNTVVPSTEHPACLVLSSPQTTKPTMAILDDKCPAIFVWKRLTSLGWVSQDGVVVHADGTKIFDGREAVRQKYYWQALLSVEDSVRLAGGSFPSTECQAFFKALLRKIPVVPGNTAAYYRGVLNDDRNKRGKQLWALEDFEDEVDGPLPLPPAPAQGEDAVVLGASELDNAPKPAPRPHGPGGRSSSSGPSKPPVPSKPPPLPPPPTPVPHEDTVVLGPESDEDAVVLAPEEPEPPPSPPPVGPERPKRVGPTARNYLDGPDGAKFVYKRYKAPDGKMYINWLTKCKFHSGCEKKRGASAQFTKTHGDIEPLAYLQAWQYIDWPASGKPTHALESPDAAVVDDMVARYADVFKDLHAEAIREGG